MPEAILTMTPAESPTQFQVDDISLIRAALFGAVVPPFLATAAFMLVRVENLSLYPSPFSFLFIFLWMMLYLSIFCAPFGVPFALLCGILARTWLRQGNGLADVQLRLGSVGAACGLVALWGVGILVGILFDGKWKILSIPEWPLLFWGTALVVGAFCGWMLPRVTHFSRSVVASSER